MHPISDGSETEWQMTAVICGPVTSISLASVQCADEFPVYLKIASSDDKLMTKSVLALFKKELELLH